MEIQVNLDAEAVQQQVVAAILESALGEEIKKAIDQFLAPQRNYGDPGPVQKAVSDVLSTQVRVITMEIINEKRDLIRSQVAAQLTDEVIGRMTTAVFGLMADKLTVSWE